MSGERVFLFLLPALIRLCLTPQKLIGSPQRHASLPCPRLSFFPLLSIINIVRHKLKNHANQWAQRESSVDALNVSLTVSSTHECCTNVRMSECFCAPLLIATVASRADSNCKEMKTTFFACHKIRQRRAGQVASLLQPKSSQANCMRFCGSQAKRNTPPLRQR